jgi:hypothetical protein
MSFPVVGVSGGSVVCGWRLDEAAMLNPSLASLFVSALESTWRQVALEVDVCMDFLCVSLHRFYLCGRFARRDKDLEAQAVLLFYSFCLVFHVAVLQHLVNYGRSWLY